MPVGSKFKLYIPQELAYAGADRGKIKPFSMLIFEVELISIEKSLPQQQMPQQQMPQQQAR